MLTNEQPLFLVKSALHDTNRAPYFRLESLSEPNNLSFGRLQQRLISFVKVRIQNGDLTERGLARLLGTSQSQLHNVLKGVRKLQPEIADRIIVKFGISILDLLDTEELCEHLRLRQSEPQINTKREPGAHVLPRKFDSIPTPKKPAQSEDTFRPQSQSA